MTDNQKIPAPSPIKNVSTYATLGSIRVSQNPEDNMTGSQISSEDALKKLNDAINEGAFEGINTDE